MLRFLKLLWEDINTKGTFLRNLSFTFGSNALIYIFNILFYPALTYFFSPEAYSQYAVWTLLYTNFLLISSLGYAEALVITKTKKEYYRLGSAILYLVVLSTLLLFGTYLAFKDLFWNQFQSDGFWYIFLVFPMIFLGALYNLMNMGTIRFKLHERTARIQAILKVSSKIIVLIAAWLGIRNGFGILLGDLVFTTAIVFFILPQELLTKFWKTFIRFDLSWSKLLLVKYNDYPKFVFPTLWLAVILQQVPIWFIGNNYESTQLGLYTFSLGLLGIPVGILIKSIRPVFFQKNIELIELTAEEKQKRVERLVKWLLAILAIYLVGSYWLVEVSFGWIFPSKWGGAKELMKILLLGTGGIFLGSPMASVFKVSGKIKLDLVIRFVSFTMLVLGCWVLIASGFDFMSFAFAYNILYFLCFATFFVFQLIEFGFTRRKILTKLSILIAIIFTCFLLTYILDCWI